MDESIHETFKIFPNPSNGQFTISHLSNIDVIEIEQTFYDINKKYKEVECEVRKLFKLERQAINEKKLEEDSSSSDDDY